MCEPLWEIRYADVPTYDASILPGGSVPYGEGSEPGAATVSVDLPLAPSARVWYLSLMKTYTQRERRALVWLAIEQAKANRSNELTLSDLAIAGIGSDEVELVKDLLHSLDLLDYLNPASYIVLAQNPWEIVLPSHYSHPFEVQQPVRAYRGASGAD